MRNAILKCGSFIPLFGIRFIIPCGCLFRLFFSLSVGFFFIPHIVKNALCHYIIKMAIISSHLSFNLSSVCVCVSIPSSFYYRQHNISHLLLNFSPHSSVTIVGIYAACNAFKTHPDWQHCIYMNKWIINFGSFHWAMKRNVETKYTTLYSPVGWWWWCGGAVDLNAGNMRIWRTWVGELRTHLNNTLHKTYYIFIWNTKDIHIHSSFRPSYDFSIESIFEASINGGVFKT